MLFKSLSGKCRFKRRTRLEGGHPHNLRISNSLHICNQHSGQNATEKAVSRDATRIYLSPMRNEAQKKPVFDVFLSHNSEDKPAVRTPQNRQGGGLRVAI